MTHYSNLDYFNEQEFRRKTKTPIFLAALLLVFLTLLISKLDKVAEIKERFLERLR